MATKPSNAQVRQCELLAQKLYGQCRDSKSAYKTLTNSIRSLRNLLEELDEVAGPSDIKILYRIVDGIAILQKLDIALVSYKCSNQIEVDVDTVVAEFKESVEDVTSDLARAYDAMTRASSTCSSSVQRRTSSQWSVVQGSEVSSTEGGLEVHLPSDEKEVSLIRTSSVRKSGVAPSWRGMFTDIDPLSIPFDDAARMFFFENEGGEEGMVEHEPQEVPTPMDEKVQQEDNAVAGAERENEITQDSAQEKLETDTIEATSPKTNDTHLSPIEIERLRQDSVLSSPLTPKAGEVVLQQFTVPAEIVEESESIHESISPTTKPDTPKIALTAPENEEIVSPTTDIGTPTIALTAPENEDQIPFDEGASGPVETEADDEVEMQNQSPETLRITSDEALMSEEKDEEIGVSDAAPLPSITFDDSEAEEESLSATNHDAVSSPAPDKETFMDQEAEAAVEQVEASQESALEQPQAPATNATSEKSSPRDMSIDGADEDPTEQSFDEVTHTAVIVEVNKTAQPEQVDVGVAPAAEDKADNLQAPKIELSFLGTLDERVNNTFVRELTVIEPAQDSPLESVRSETEAIEARNETEPDSPSMPTRAPPPPPPPLLSRPSFPLTAEVLTVSRASSPSPSDASEDLYSATPPMKPTQEPEFHEFKLEPLQLPDKPQATEEQKSGLNAVIKLAQDENLEKTANAAPSLRRTSGVPKKRYYAYYASDEYYKSSGAAKTDKSLPPVPTETQSPVTSKPRSPSGLKIEDVQTIKAAIVKRSTNLLMPARYLHQRRKSAPPPASASLVAPLQRQDSSQDTLDVVTEKSAALQLIPPPSLWKPRRSVDEALHTRKHSEQPKPPKAEWESLTSHKPEWESPDMVGIKEWYGTEREVTPTAMLDQERIHHIVAFWNERRWDEAAQYLVGHMDSLVARKETASIRRVKHLLAVCSSFRGHWDNAIERFLEVLQRPVTNIFHLDDGDCAAAYWLGDLYAMQNRRADALLAYSIAEKSTLFSDVDPSVQLTISAEQAAVQIGVTKSDFKRTWNEHKIGHASSPSMLDPMIVSIEAAKQCLDTEAHRASQDPLLAPAFHFSPGRSRANYLHQTRLRYSLFKTHPAMKLTNEVFNPSSPWPMMYDPLFCMANVSRMRLLAYECDMLSIFQKNPEIKLPRPTLMRLDCFTCNDMAWLISTIRSCLRTYEMGYSEVVNIQTTAFLARYHFLQHRIATTHYFSITLFKHPFRNGYVGVEICGEEMSSARLVENDLEYENGVHTSEAKRVRLLVREFLDEGWKRWKEERLSGGMAPPIPPKPM